MPSVGVWGILLCTVPSQCRALRLQWRSRACCAISVRWMCAARGAGVRRRSGSGEKTGIFIAAAFSADSKCRAADMTNGTVHSPPKLNFQTSRPSLCPATLPDGRAEQAEPLRAARVALAEPCGGRRLRAAYARGGGASSSHSCLRAVLHGSGCGLNRHDQQDSCLGAHEVGLGAWAFAR